MSAAWPGVFEEWVHLRVVPVHGRSDGRTDGRHDDNTRRSLIGWLELYCYVFALVSCACGSAGDTMDGWMDGCPEIKKNIQRTLPLPLSV